MLEQGLWLGGPSGLSSVAPEQLTAPVWASVSPSGKWKDGDRVVQASHGGDEVRGRKGMWELSACSLEG